MECKRSARHKLTGDFSAIAGPPEGSLFRFCILLSWQHVENNVQRSRGLYLDETILKKELNDLLEQGQQAGMVDADASLQEGECACDLWQLAVVRPQAVHSRIEHCCHLHPRICNI